ncbi:triose-phosphate isomerase [soil metagenome]
MFYFGTNLKMYGTPAETAAFVEAVERGLEHQSELQCFVLPPFTSLPTLAPALERTPKPSHLWLGAQTMHWADEGAYTGEISPLMLKALDVDLVMVGHAERRRGGETDAVVRKKVSSALRHGFRVLLCVGETRAQKERGTGAAAVSAQLDTALRGVFADDRVADGRAADRVMVAYEPVWAIGAAGREADAAEVQAMLKTLRDTLNALFGPRHVPILYGGSVTEANCAAYARLSEVDGLFVGRAARRADGFLRVLAAALEARSLVTGRVQ